MRNKLLYQFGCFLAVLGFVGILVCLSIEFDRCDGLKDQKEVSKELELESELLVKKFQQFDLNEKQQKQIKVVIKSFLTKTNMNLHFIVSVFIFLILSIGFLLGLIFMLWSEVKQLKSVKKHDS